MAYMYFFDAKKQGTAPTSYQAVAALYEYLEACLRHYKKLKHEYAWIAAIKNDGTRSPCHDKTAIQLLGEIGEIRLFCESKEHGIFHQASACDDYLHKAHKLIAQADAKQTFKVTEESKKLSPHDATRHRNAAIGLQKAEKKMQLLPSYDDLSMQWHPGESNPIKILRAAEERIFSYNLYHVILDRGLHLFEIEKQCKFATGTIIKMMHGTCQLRPTEDMVDKLARVLKIKPEELWYDAMKPFLDTTDSWKKYLSDNNDGS